MCIGWHGRFCPFPDVDVSSCLLHAATLVTDALNSLPDASASVTDRHLHEMDTADTGVNSPGKKRTSDATCMAAPELPLKRTRLLADTADGKAIQGKGVHAKQRFRVAFC